MHTSIVYRIYYTSDANQRQGGSRRKYARSFGVFGQFLFRFLQFYWLFLDILCFFSVS